MYFFLYRKGDVTVLVNSLVGVARAQHASVLYLINGILLLTLHDHISPVLRQLHWLPVFQRVTFKLAVLVFKALHGLAPRYLADDCQLVTDAGRRHHRSSESATCVLQRTNTRFGDRAFRLAGPSVWNNLPVDLQHPDLSLGQFHRELKTFLFNRFCSA